MTLSLDGLKGFPAGYKLPAYDIAAMRRRTRHEPVWLHFGAGNIFRLFPAARMQALLNEGLTDRGILVCETFDPEILERAFAPYDNLCIGVTLKADGTMEKEVTASIAAAFTPEGNREELEAVFRAPSLQMVSFTVTEKGYAAAAAGGALPPHIAADCAAGPAAGGGHSLMGLVCRLMYIRYRAGGAPVALVSMDNCSRNGDKLRAVVTLIAEAWVRNGLAEEGFTVYLGGPRVTYPLTMIDKITPRPDMSVLEALRSDGAEGLEITVTAKNTYASAFVNGEEAGYLVIEDEFPNGRPPLEKAGVIFTGRETVERTERMKVCTCLNPLHTALGVFGCLLGYDSIWKEMKDSRLRGLIEGIGAAEGLPVVTDPGIIDPAEFLREVTSTRFPNPFVPDTPQRIACDTSQKIPVRFGETLKEYVRRGEELSKLTYIPFFIAGWLRYLLGVNDEGGVMELSPDPNLDELRRALETVRLGDTEARGSLRPILRRADIFGVDLTLHGLEDKINGFFSQLNAGPGAVDKTLTRLFDEAPAKTVVIKNLKTPIL